MRKFETYTQPAMEKTRLVETTCDLCGRVASRGDWDSSNYEVAESEVKVIVRQKGGTAYPEGGSGTEIVVDVCPKCFKEKLVPFLRSQGAKIEEREWDLW